MEQSTLFNLLGNPAVLIPQLDKANKSKFQLDAYNEYDPTKHKINLYHYRPDKTINKPSGEIDANTGEPIYHKSVEKVTRLAIPLQRLIVSRGASFLTAGGCTLKPDTDNSEGQDALFQLVSKTWKVNKLDYKNHEIAQAFMSETECCEIWYSKKNSDGSVEMKCNVYKPSEGYILTPIFDNTRDLIAFSLGYEYIDEEDNKAEYRDVYTSDKLIKYVKRAQEEWKILQTIPLLYGKIPVVYYSIAESIWSIVQPLIERLELLLSNFSDTNDYAGAPILFANGTIKGFSSKGETGKVLEGENDADVKYITWEQAPESIKLEIETLKNLIFTCTQTPDISFYEMKGLGDISGAAFERIMIDAHLKAKGLQSGVYGEGIQRRLNLLVYACAAITPSLSKTATDLEIYPVFKLFKLDDDYTRIQNALMASGGATIMSQLEAISYGGFSDNARKTQEDILSQEAISKKEVIPAQNTNAT